MTLHDDLIRDCQYMNNFFSDSENEFSAIAAIAIYFIKNEPGIATIKLNAYFHFLNAESEKSNGELLFDNRGITRLENCLASMRENGLIFIREKNESYLNELSITTNQDTQDIDAHLPEMLRTVERLLAQALNNGRCLNILTLENMKYAQKCLDSYYKSTNRGTLYEYFVGYRLFEAFKCEIEYVGRNGGGDGGIDLICKRDGVTLLVQCKNIQTNVDAGQMRAFIGAIVLYKKDHPGEKVKGAFICSTSFSQFAKNAAQKCDIFLVSGLGLPREFPLIKCCDKNKKYYLPTDPVYDLIKPDSYCSRILQAEKQGYNSQQLILSFN